MANNWTWLSCAYKLPDKYDEDEIWKLLKETALMWLRENDQIDSDAEDDPFSRTSLQVEIDEDGVWFHHDESAEADLVAELVSSLQKLYHQETFTFGYCYACSKPRLDEFGGGAFAILPDGKILYCNPESTVQKRAEVLLKRRKPAQKGKRR